MAYCEMLPVGNNMMEDNDEVFSDGFLNGTLYYYDTNHQLPRPFSCQAICNFMQENLHDERATIRWNAGFVFGWIAALSENRPDYFFTSIVQPETKLVHHSTLQ